MKIDATFLRSKVARRIFMLFVLSALLPIATLALLSFHQVSQQLYTDGQRQLHRDSKAIGMALLEKLSSLETTLRFIAAQLETRSAFSRAGRIDATNPGLQSRFKALALTTDKGDPLPLRGDIKDLPRFSKAQLHHLGAGKALVLTLHPAGSPPRIVLALTLDPHQPGQGTLIGEIDNKTLWNLDIAGTSRFCVLDDRGQSLFCSHPLPKVAREKVTHELIQSSSGRFNWQHQGQSYLTNFWSLFLEPTFYTPRWTVILTETEANVLAAMDHFRAVFPPIILMSLLIVIWLSVSQIRNYLIPLENLMKATRRVAHRDFNTPVKIKSGDEFETLGHAFNQMATQLGKQFNTLATMAEIDRIILSASEAQYIMETLVKRMSEVIACDLAYVAKRDNEDPTKLHLYIPDDRAQGKIRTETVVLKADEARNLVNHSGHLVFDSQAMLPSHLVPINQLGARHFLVLPIVLKGELAAIIGLGFWDQPRLADEDLSRARELADRAAVALSNAAWEEKLYHQAHYDGLTDLPNRLLLKDRLDQALERAKRSDSWVAVLFIDLDRFKGINDSLGHSAGDQLLIEAAQALTKCVRGTDTVVRFGGDEFIIILPDLNGHHKEISRITLSADKILSAVSRSFTLGAHEINTTASMGIALYPRDGTSAEDLMRNADAAMYHAKNMGKGNYQFYAQELNATALERLKIQNSLTYALERSEFIVYYQPRVDVRTGEITGAEALLRWQHPELGRVSPAKFIPIAEETGLIAPIGEWVLRAACAQNKAWQEQGLPKIRVSVNLSALQFRQAHLSAQVEQALRAAGLLPHYLELEITEGIAIHNVEKGVAMLSKLKAMGVYLAMDDFGTGYSSLSYLKRFPIHTLKIDQSFIRTIPKDTDSVAIARAIIALAHSLGLRALAEGVETDEQYEFLQGQGCDEIQGYFISRPVPAEEFTKLLEGTNRAKELLSAPYRLKSQHI